MQSAPRLDWELVDVGVCWDFPLAVCVASHALRTHVGQFLREPAVYSWMRLPSGGVEVFFSHQFTHMRNQSWFVTALSGPLEGCAILAPQPALDAIPPAGDPYFKLRTMRDPLHLLFPQEFPPDDHSIDEGGRFRGGRSKAILTGALPREAYLWGRSGRRQCGGQLSQAYDARESWRARDREGVSCMSLVLAELAPCAPGGHIVISADIIVVIVEV
jgi:hypothetical protein